MHKKIEIKTLGKWLAHQQTNYKKTNYMKNDIIVKAYKQFLLDYREYFISNDDKWFNTLEEVKQYIDKNNIKPSQTHKKIEIKTLGKWLSQQQTNYNKKTKCMKNDIIVKAYEQFLLDYREYFTSNDDKWYAKFQETKKYIESNKCKPAKDVIDIHNWFNTQTQNYKHKKNIMSTNEKIYNDWTNFKIKYEKYL